MGRDGGVARGATGGGNAGRGDNTPGSPQNDKRQGRHAEGSTPSSRARDAMSRHQREAKPDYGMGDSYSLTGSLKAAEDAGTMSPRQRDMAIGMEAARPATAFSQAVGGVLSGMVSGATGVMGSGSVASKAAGEGITAGAVPDNPESRYGAAHTKSRMKNNTVQNVAEGVAGFFGGPAAGYAANALNAGINMNKTKDIGELNADMDARREAGKTTVSRPGGGAQKAATAMRGPAASQAPAAQAQSFSWNPIDMTEYNRGLISLAQGQQG